MAHARPKLPRINLRLDAEYPNDPRVQQLHLQILNNPNYANNVRAPLSYLVFLTAQEMYEVFVRQARGVNKKRSGGPEKPILPANPGAGPQNAPGCGGGGSGSGGSGPPGGSAPQIQPPNNGVPSNQVSSNSGSAAGSGSGSGASSNSGAGSGAGAGSSACPSSGAGSGAGAGSSAGSNVQAPPAPPPLPQVPMVPGVVNGQEMYLPLGPVNGLPQQLGTAGSDNSGGQASSPGSQNPPTKPVAPRGKLGKGR
ncbi:capsid protein [Alcelaphine gammaherpesvirus 1]|uniref:Small capsomere-interacting protein n=1 Tax=Alcelaphine herpesvirus 1 (strain C500) TaxID=654901 RepID=SCP_ALHV1|nr:capsid protein [Alcelaphine gammaherpesvirus 1]O36415.1 RecName: Full=Small capsomere-interacting protein [Alcelaphine herpesvirus 1 strain C500]AAC58112.1 capsid protein [Alcelaphine gammaherpesvirus 1]APB09488.1 small capsid protein [Alcelaphine gammaherpesvirus 1]APB09560.1 small capsid protein [Alcelaphine gammaherpesvirus 1]ATI21947.1 ORF65 [Alcelaphine gammaherpesvirus 1]QDY92298.1 small capsid protein [Alcelaphine gammaherpesvirus 1]